MPCGMAPFGYVRLGVYPKSATNIQLGFWLYIELIFVRFSAGTFIIYNS